MRGQLEEPHPWDVRKAAGARGRDGRKRKGRTPKPRSVKKQGSRRQRPSGNSRIARLGKNNDFLLRDLQEQTHDHACPEARPQPTRVSSLIESKTVPCSGCKKFVARFLFSNQQLCKASTRRRCVPCVAADQTRLLASSNKAKSPRYAKLKLRTSRKNLNHTSGRNVDRLVQLLRRAEKEEQSSHTFKHIRRQLITSAQLPRSIRSLPEGSDLQVSLASVHSVPATRFAQHFRQHPHAEVRLMWHGTPRHNFRGIMRHGLLVPGTNGVKVANGACYGTGIYAAHDIQTSLSYTKGTDELFLCAVIFTADEVKSHPNLVVVKNPACICPLLVVQHLTYQSRQSGYNADADQTVRQLLAS